RYPLAAAVVAALLVGIRGRDETLGDGDREIERRLETGFVETGEAATRVVRFEMSEDIGRAPFLDAIDAAQAVRERRIVVDLELGLADRDLIGEQEHQLFRLLPRLRGHAKARVGGHLASRGREHRRTN